MIMNTLGVLACCLLVTLIVERLYKLRRATQARPVAGETPREAPSVPSGSRVQTQAAVRRGPVQPSRASGDAEILAQLVLGILNASKHPLKAKEIASIAGDKLRQPKLSRSDVNSLLYGELRRYVTKDSLDRWTAIVSVSALQELSPGQNSVPSAPERLSSPVPRLLPRPDPLLNHSAYRLPEED